VPPVDEVREGNLQGSRVQAAGGTVCIMQTVNP